MTPTIALLAGIAGKSILVAGIGVVLLALMRGRSSAERSLVAHLTLAALVILPVAALLLPSWSPLPAGFAASAAEPTLAPVIAPTLEADPGSGLSGPAVGADPSTMSAWDIGLILYLVPLALLGIAILVAVGRLFTMRARAAVLVETPWLIALAQAQRRMGFKHGTALLVSDELRSPISWGLMRPTILLDPAAAASRDEAEAIIAHELAHVAQLDWAKLLVARTACALFWFNPLVWMLARESHQLREEAADDAVLRSQVDGPRYAALLVSAARHDNGAVLLAAHGVAPSRNSLRRRVTRILDDRLARGPAGARSSMVGLVALLGLAAPLAAFTLGEVGQTEPAVAAPPTRPGAPEMPATPEIAAPALPAAPGQVRMVAVSQDARIIAPEALIAARATGVEPAYVAQIERAVGRVDLEEVAAARATGVDADYIAAMKAAMPDLDLDELIGARAVGVTPAYAAAIRREMPRVDLSDLIGMYAVGVTPDYVRSLRQAGIDLSDADEVTGSFASAGIGGARAAGPRTPPPPLPPRRD